MELIFSQAAPSRGDQQSAGADIAPATTGTPKDDPGGDAGDGEEDNTNDDNDSVRYTATGCQMDMRAAQYPHTSRTAADTGRAATVRSRNSPTWPVTWERPFGPRVCAAPDLTPTPRGPRG